MFLPYASEGWGKVIFSLCITPHLDGGGEGRGGTPHQLLTGGYTHPVPTRGYPHPVSIGGGGVPPSSPDRGEQGGTPMQSQQGDTSILPDRGYPRVHAPSKLDGGTPPHTPPGLDGGTTLLSVRTGWRYPPVRTGWGYPSPIVTGWGYPLPPSVDRAATRRAACLLRSRRTFLF